MPLRVPRLSVPLHAERIPSLDAVDPFEALTGLRQLPGPHLLLDAPVQGPLARFAFASADPCGILVADGREARLLDASGRTVTRGPVFETLRRVLADWPRDVVPGAPPFQGGLAGLVSYDAGRILERIPESAADDRGLPLLHMACFDAVLAWDLARGEAWGFAREAPRDLRVGDPEDRLRRLVVAASSRLRDRDSPPGSASLPGSSFHVGPLEAGMTHAGFEERVARCRELVAEGEVYQVNLSQRFTASFSGDEAALYAALRRANAAPFAAWYDAGEFAVLSSSPERLVQVSGRAVTMRPIAGTRPRGDSPEEDARLKAELREDEKERAEHVMLVDLARNDLGRVCRYGSVRVDDYLTVESYRRVHHLVSGVRGILEDDRTAVDALMAAFPGGTITGAPKVRAMEIIDDLEPVRRHAYTGSVGYLTPGGDADFNILIRTLTLTGPRDARRVDLQVGAGIVHDSVPAREHAETLAKARALVEALEASTR